MTEIKRPNLDVTVQQQFAGLIVLDRVITEQEKIHSSLMDNGNNVLDPVLKHLESEGILEVGEDLFYKETPKGEQAYEKLLQQQASYAAHFDIYAYIDLEAGVFADKETDLLEDDRWSDLRVAVAEYKGIDPYRIVFLAMLSDEAFFDNPDWKFDLAMGTLFEQMRDIVQTQIHVSELGYQDGSRWISGEAVLQDVIEQGARLNQDRFEQKRHETSEEHLDRNPEEVITTTTYYTEGYPPGSYPYYNPLPMFGAYLGSALFLEAMWHDPYW